MILVLVALLCSPGWANAVSEDDFILDTTGDLMELCTVPSSDPLQGQAVSFCYGFLVGAYHYHMAENAGPSGSPMVCPPPRARNCADPSPPGHQKKVPTLFCASSIRETCALH